VADVADRRERIRSGAVALAQASGGQAVIEEALLDEVTALVEWPVPLVGRFDERYLELPQEVPIATMQDHQRYFPVRDAQGKLRNEFIAVANIESRAPEKVRDGNERVVRPRLADAAFFWDTDRRQRLETRRAMLKNVTFQAKLGSLHDKSERVGRLAVRIAESIGAETVLAARAAQLSKCDLLTLMVGEFPELQGLMGKYYAQHDGERPKSPPRSKNSIGRASLAIAFRRLAPASRSRSPTSSIPSRASSRSAKPSGTPRSVRSATRSARCAAHDSRA
jgi:glycyl-tRNA synthetase beta chain